MPWINDPGPAWEAEMRELGFEIAYADSTEEKTRKESRRNCFWSTAACST